MPVDSQRQEYTQNVAKWQRARDCYKGEDAVKAGGVKYLPMLDSHRTAPTKYSDYLLRAYFYNALRRTVDGLAGAVFQKAPMVRVSGLVEPDLKDIALSNVPLELFALRMMKEVLKVARVGVLIDMPTEGERLRPYWTYYLAEQVISWFSQRHSGNEVLTQVVLCEFDEQLDDKDPFVIKMVERYRVLYLQDGVYTQALWEKDGSSWVVKNTVQPLRRGEKLSFIPFTFTGPTTISSTVEESALDDLVSINLSHYRGVADLKHGLHFAALPTPWISGQAASETGVLAIGSGEAWVLEKEGRAGMLEVAGPGFAAIRQDLEDMKKMMATLGARLLEEQAGAAETATAVGMRHAGDHATLRTIAQTVEQSVTLLLRWHEWWVGTAPTPADIKDVSFELNKDFFTVRASADEVRAALLAFQAGAISFATFYERLQRGGWAREGVTADQERKTIDEELPEEVEKELEDEVIADSGDWQVVKRGEKFLVIVAETGEILGEHDEEEGARAQLATLSEEAT